MKELIFWWLLINVIYVIIAILGRDKKVEYLVHYSEEHCEILEGTEQEIREAAIEKAHELHVDIRSCWSDKIED